MLLYFETVKKRFRWAYNSDLTRAPWLLNSSAGRLFVQQLAQYNNKDNIKAPHYSPFLRGIHWWLVYSPHAGLGGAGNAEIVSMSWRHHGNSSVWSRYPVLSPLIHPPWIRSTSQSAASQSSPIITQWPAERLPDKCTSYPYPFPVKRSARMLSVTSKQTIMPTVETSPNYTNVKLSFATTSLTTWLVLDYETGHKCYRSRGSPEYK